MWMASFTTRSIYPDVLSKMMMLLKSIWCPVFTLCSATTDFSSWSRRMCLVCSLHLVPKDLPVCPTYIFPHSHGIRYTPGTLRPKSSLTILSMCIFFFGNWTVLMLCLARSLLYLWAFPLLVLSSGSGVQPA
jgi:hypothetical protein